MVRLYRLYWGRCDCTGYSRDGNVRTDYSGDGVFVQAVLGTV